jgi:hypothetical protein
MTHDPVTFPMSSLGNWDDGGGSFQIEEERAIALTRTAALVRFAHRSLQAVSAHSGNGRLSRWWRHG